jgi:origin recognition complex subunit 4
LNSPKKNSETTFHPPSLPHFPTTTPSKKQAGYVQTTSPSRLPGALPPHLHPFLDAQKRMIMSALRNPPTLADDCNDDDSNSTNAIAYEDVCDLLSGTVNRGEGNSCLLIGPRGSGKTRVSAFHSHHVLLVYNPRL